jgi:hypothetical protein
MAGIRRVVLRRYDELPARDRRRAHRMLGRYHHDSGADDAWIELFVDVICDGYTTFWLRRKWLQRILFARVLFHEVGHHIHKTKKPEHAARETTADAWAEILTRKFLKRRYWYFAPLAWISRNLIRLLRDRRASGLAPPSMGAG